MTENNREVNLTSHQMTQLSYLIVRALARAKATQGSIQTIHTDISLTITCSQVSGKYKYATELSDGTKGDITSKLSENTYITLVGMIVINILGIMKQEKREQFDAFIIFLNSNESMQYVPDK